MPARRAKTRCLTPLSLSEAVGPSTPASGDAEESESRDGSFLNGSWALALGSQVDILTNDLYLQKDQDDQIPPHPWCGNNYWGQDLGSGWLQV